MRRILKCFAAGLLSLTMAVPAAAADYRAQADALHEMGLFRGTENGYELEKSFTREEAAAMLVRLLGVEQQVEKVRYASVFADVGDSRWSKNAIMYCFEQGITKGTGADAYSPEETIPAEQFVALILRTLGYTSAEPQTALDAAVEYGLLGSSYVWKLRSQGVFLRDDMVHIAYRCLQTPTKEGTVFAQKLRADGVLTQTQADSLDIQKAAQDIDDVLNALLEQ